MLIWLLPFLAAVFILLEKIPSINKWLNLAWIALILTGIISIYKPTITNWINTDYQYIRQWNGFHYYLGSKYFGELGNFSLYNCAFAADKNINFWSEISQVRNLQNYQVVNKNDLHGCNLPTFSQQRWAEFSQDVNFWKTKFPKDNNFWSKLFLDKGYNPTPVWTMIGGSLTNWANLQNIWAIKLLFISEWLIILAGLYYLASTYSLRPVLIMSSWILFFFGTHSRLIGNLGQYWWLGLLIWSWAGWNRKKYFLSGLVVGIAFMLRIFPIVLAVPILLRLHKSFLHQTSHLPYSRWLLGFFTSSIILLALTLHQPGWPAWIEFYKKITSHSNFLNTELFNLGLKNFLITLNLNRSWFFWFAALTWTGTLLTIIWKISSPYLLAIGSLLIYPWLTLSPYYHLIFSGLILITYKNSQTANTLLIAAWFLIFSLFGKLGITAQHFASDSIFMHTISESLIALILFTWTLIFIKNLKK